MIKDDGLKDEENRKNGENRKAGTTEEKTIQGRCYLAVCRAFADRTLDKLMADDTLTMDDRLRSVLIPVTSYAVKLGVEPQYLKTCVEMISQMWAEKIIAVIKPFI
ncbi:MAG: hypothetical protein ACI4CS_08145 [Candidatus Weimeria sp.]